MRGIREFSKGFGNPKDRSIGDRVPGGFLNEFIDLVFVTGIEDVHAYRVMLASSGMRGPGKPYAGNYHGLQRDLADLEWTRVLDLIPRMYREVEKLDAGRYTGEPELPGYVEGVNRLLAGYNLAWDLTTDGTLVRAVSPHAREAQDSALDAISDERFEGARQPFIDGLEALNGRPMRPRDACIGLFHAAESVANTAAGTLKRTYGDAIDLLLRDKKIDRFVHGQLKALELVRHNHFGHGKTDIFTLSEDEVVFVSHSCFAAIGLLTKV